MSQTPTKVTNGPQRVDITLRFTIGHPEAWFEPDEAADGFVAALNRFLTEHDAMDVLMNFIGDDDDVELVAINKVAP